MKENESDFHYLPETVKDELMSLHDSISAKSETISKDVWEHFTPEFLDTQSGSIDVPEAIKLQHDRRTLYESARSSQIEAHVKIPTPHIATIYHFGDIHWGSVFCNDKLWDEYRTKVMETPGAYIMFYHNLVDNAIPAKFPSNMLRNGVPPDVQFSVMQSWIKELDAKGKILGAVTSDCHEGWSWQQTGQDASKLLYGYEGRQFPLLENGGILDVSVGNETYQIGMWHKQGPFHSNFNTEHSLRQLRRLRHESTTDIEVGAHYHDAVASADWSGALNRLKLAHYLAVGTFKGVPSGDEKNYITDRWAVDKFGSSGEPPGVSTTLWPDVHRISHEVDFETGLEKHLSLRTYYLVKEMGLEEEFTRILGQP